MIFNFYGFWMQYLPISLLSTAITFELNGNEAKKKYLTLFFISYFSDINHGNEGGLFSMTIVYITLNIQQTKNPEELYRSKIFWYVDQMDTCSSIICVFFEICCLIHKCNFIFLGQRNSGQKQTTLF